MTTKPQSLEEIRRNGLDALAQALGPLGMVRFLQQFETGRGDYTQERHQWLSQNSVRTITQCKATIKTRDWTLEQRENQAKVRERTSHQHWDRINSDPALKQAEIERRGRMESAFVALRLRLNMTQLELAHAIGVTEECVQNWEAPRTHPRAANRKRLDNLAVERGVAKIDWSKV
ncbi:MAG: hypothetical protein JWN98_930 [Abditibacteriota bacterium]|nr:hypothetical protein [Abditibacteriota bacterium]